MAPPEVLRRLFFVKVEVNTPVIHRWFGSSVMFSSSYKVFLMSSRLASNRHG